MTERCNKCGTELFAGQQFCRQCGAPTRQFSTGEIPTQILPGAQGQPPPPQATARQPYAGTTPLGGRDTDSVYQSRFAEQYYPPAAAPVALPTETAQLQRKRSRGKWVVGLLCVLVLLVGGSLLAAQFIVDQLRHQVIVHKTTRGVPSVPPVAPIPGLPGADASDDADLSPLDEAGAQVSGDKTVITKTFALKPDAAFSLQQIRGDVTIEGWDQNEAQVTITKQGGDADDRAGVEIMHAATAKGLTLRTPEDMDTVREIKYEIKLPRALRRVEINAQDADVTLSNLAGEVSVNTMRGDLSLTKLTGGVATHTMKGDIKVDLKSATPAQRQEFNSVKGDITLNVGGANADLQAETVAGGVSADDSLGVNIEKQLAGSHAEGRVGKGGQMVAAKTVSGSIKIKQ
ncbi:MAG: hypothetical protein ACJ741_07460 [Pyrinomonadaceae bacterium]